MSDKDKFDPNDIDAFVNLTSRRQQEKKAEEAANNYAGTSSPIEHQQMRREIKKKLNEEKEQLLKERRKKAKKILNKIIIAIIAASTIATGVYIGGKKDEKDKKDKGTKILVDACEENLLAWGLGEKVNGEFEIGENSISDYKNLEANTPLEVYGYKLAINDYEEFSKFIQSVSYQNGMYYYTDYSQFLRINGYYNQEKNKESNEVFENMMEATILAAIENDTLNSYVENEFYTFDMNNDTNKTR